MGVMVGVRVGVGVKVVVAVGMGVGVSEGSGVWLRPAIRAVMGPQAQREERRMESKMKDKADLSMISPLWVGWIDL